MHTRSPIASYTEEAFLTEVTCVARRCARRILLDDDDAEDVAQDIALDWLIGIRSGHVTAVTTGLPALVRTMVVRRIVDAYRASERRALRDGEFSRELTDLTRVWMSPEQGIEEQELDEFFTRTLASVPPMCRRVYVMVREDERSYQAVADALGITRGTVQKHVSQAQKRIRKELIEQEIMSAHRRPRRHDMTTG